MTQTQFTSKEYIRKLKIIHFGLLIGLLLFAANVVFLNQDSKSTTDSGLETFRIVASVMAIVCVSASLTISRMQMKQILLKSNLFDKLAGYQVTNIIRYALLEMPGLFALVFYLLTASNFFLILAGIIIALMVFQRPTSLKLIEELQLSFAERQIIENPDAVITQKGQE